MQIYKEQKQWLMFVYLRNNNIIYDAYFILYSQQKWNDSQTDQSLLVL